MLELDSSTKLFADNASWEPGYTEVAYLMLENKGELAFNYELSLNIYDEIGGVNVKDSDFKLSEFIYAGAKFDTDEDEITVETRDDASLIASAKLTSGLNLVPSDLDLMKEGELEKIYCAIVVQMPSSVGNEANYKAEYEADGSLVKVDGKVKNKPSIDLGVTVFAKQAAVEMDDFTDMSDPDSYYDVNSKYFKPIEPDKEGLEDATDTDAKTVTISTAEQLVAFADSVNVEKESYSGYTVNLVDDIDLAGHIWEPIGQTGNAGFLGVFDGNGNTISNLVIDSSAHNELTSSGKYYYSTGLFGWVEAGGSCVIKDLKINNAKAIGYHNVAIVVGYLNGAVVDNVDVTNATVICNYANSEADGDKAGIIAGNASQGSPKGTIKGCDVANSTVTAGRDAGQIAGMADEALVTECSATNVSVAHTGDANTTGNNIRNELVGRLA